MKKLLLTLAVPMLLLASCNGGGVNINGTVNNGTSISQETLDKAAAVPEDKKQEIEAIAKKGISGKAIMYMNTTSSSQGSNVHIITDLNLDFSVENPSMSFTTSGTYGATASASGQNSNVNGSVTGKSEAKLQNDSWNILDDFMTITVNGQQQKQSPVLFGGSAASCAEFYNSFSSSLYSWSYNFESGMIGLSQAAAGAKELYKNFVVAGDVSTGNYEVGLSTTLSLDVTGSKINFTKFRVAYNDYLLKEAVMRYEVASTYSAGSTTVISEIGYIFNYSK